METGAATVVGACGSGEAGSIAAGMGVKSITTKVQTTTAKFQFHAYANAKPKCKPPAGQENGLIVKADQVAHAICTVRTHTALTEQSLSTMELTALCNDPGAQLLAELATKGATDTKATAPQKEEIVDKLFGGKDTKVQEKYIKRLATTPIAFTLGSDKKYLKITDLKDSDDYGYALVVAFYQN
ncbi:uncharacterized protein TEOVI_000216100 [Trypanosoma equiperdum]|uniref:Uncharacterized protein n=1 Tax=Trypanosoma equiperdum TaxID=5694 RepID=A0A1G4IEA5_TRYEQ|nr:hypothetical protein TEOVI_000216100 [Trypanosoma equiperdum]